ncbi:hypothetical protein SAMN04487770_12019 [Butyrivibrio sp. ob235]|uniref:hypothetical protein n=1 Tax=Butyrivibrio sp. ob235 TaxID=1761780 RepID=UPI0008B34D7D|nr:hypothetical protein [Butyrivibrio sp. ob235]SEL89424.1 hypothetical protein SAMN04487770_12019 [Butyrivibrio sp. ob235]
MSKIKINVIKSLKNNAGAIKEKQSELESIQLKIRKMDSEKEQGFKIDEKKRHELIVRKDHLITVIADSVNAAKFEAEKIYDDEIERLRIADMPKAEDISPDAELLKSGVRLTPDELLHLMNKKENQNTTMYRMFNDFAEDHKYMENISVRQAFKTSFSGHADEIAEMQDEKGALQYVSRWLNRDDACSMIDKMLGDGEVATL